MTMEKSGKTQFRAPLSGYFKVEIYLIEDDFEKGSELLSTLNEL
jgi:hypothetical protein